MAWNMSNILVNESIAIKKAGGGSGSGGSAADVTYDNTTSHLTASNVQAALDELVVNFQAGVDSVYNACVAKGSTPASHSLGDVVTAIGNISGSLDILLYVIETKSTSGQDAAVTVKKYLNGTLQTSTDYLYSDVQEAPANIDDYFDLDYGITAMQSWTYKLKVASLLQHAVNYTKTWGFTLTVSEAENFEVAANVSSSDTLTKKKKGVKNNA